jgi:hypothetical protein
MVKFGCKSYFLSATKAPRHKENGQPGKKGKHKLVNGIFNFVELSFVAKYTSLTMYANLIYVRPSIIANADQGTYAFL